MAESDLKRLVPAMEQLAGNYFYELVDSEIVKEGFNRYLRIYIDKPGGITLDDCEIYHRAVAALVEAIDYDFLEVCSPGLDRPLKSARDFERHLGKPVEIHLYKPQNGQKVFEGLLRERQEDRVSIECGGSILSFAMKEIAVCKPAVQLSEEDFDLQQEDAADE